MCTVTNQNNPSQIPYILMSPLLQLSYRLIESASIYVRIICDVEPKNYSP